MTENFKIYGTVDKEFTKVPKAIIRDNTLSSDAKVILAFLIDLTGDFNVNERGLASILGISEFKVRKAVCELDDAGYISRKRLLNGSKFAGWFWNISPVPLFESKIPHVKNSSVTESRVVDSSVENSSVTESSVNFSRVADSKYIKDRKDQRLKDTRLKEEKTVRDETGEREFALTPTTLNQSGENIISSGELNTHQAFNRFCEVYPKLGNREQARAAFFAIPDIDKICWQIANSVEWFEQSRRWDNWQTGQKNVSCPQAVKFLTRGDWQEYLKSNQTVSFAERIKAQFPDEGDNYETDKQDIFGNYHGLA